MLRQVSSRTSESPAWQTFQVTAYEILLVVLLFLLALEGLAPRFVSRFFPLPWLLFLTVLVALPTVLMKPGPRAAWLPGGFIYGVLCAAGLLILFVFLAAWEEFGPMAWPAALFAALIVVGASLASVDRRTPSPTAASNRPPRPRRPDNKPQGSAARTVPRIESPKPKTPPRRVRRT